MGDPAGTLVVAARFRGPPDSGNGGYVCGALAERLACAPGEAAEVTLRSPMPLDRALTVLCGEHGMLRVVDGETLIAEARTAPLEIEVPEPPGFEAALAARPDSVSFAKDVAPLRGLGIGFHPICFCCGAELPPGEGLHVHAAPLGEQVAAAWTPAPSLARPDGTLPPEYLWTALDCPGQFAFLAGGVRTGMLGRMTGRIDQPVRAGERCVVTGWRIGVERRKHFAGTAIFDESGTLCALAHSVWIGVR
jgi:hypothetical protein